MKKSSFVALVMGCVSTVFFALGMCMALLPEWDLFREGIVFGLLGLLLGLITVAVWCKMEHKKIPKIGGKHFLKILYTVISALILGAGLCLCLV